MSNKCTTVDRLLLKYYPSKSLLSPRSEERDGAEPHFPRNQRHRTEYNIILPLMLKPVRFLPLKESKQRAQKGYIFEK